MLFLLMMLFLQTLSIYSFRLGDQGDGSLVSFGDLGLFTEDPFSCLSDDTKTDSSQSFNLPDRQPFAFAASEHFVPL